MQNIGEEICGEYLNHVKLCDFVTYNVTTPDTQGEIDVIGIALNKKAIYVCEVAVHTQGLQYVTNKRPDDYNRFMAKFDKDIQYARKYFPDYEICPMLWSPVVKVSSAKAKYNTLMELERLVSDIKDRFGLELVLVINHKFKQALEELKKCAANEKAELKSNVMRMLQIEMSLEKHLVRLGKNNG